MTFAHELCAASQGPYMYIYRYSNSVRFFSKEDNLDIPAHVLSKPDTCTSYGVLNQISHFGLYTKYFPLRGNGQLCKANISSWLLRAFKNVPCKVYTCTYLRNVDISGQRVGSEWAAVFQSYCFIIKNNYHGKDFY